MYKDLSRFGGCMVGLLAKMAVGTAIIVVIAEGVEYWRSLYYPEQQWLIVPLIMVLTILAIILNLWLLMRRYDIREINEKKKGQSSSGHMTVRTGSAPSPGPITALSVTSRDTPPISA